MVIGVIGVARAELLGNAAVVLAARVGVADQQRDGRPGSQPQIDASEDFHRIVLMALRGVPGLAGGAARQIGAELLGRNGDARRTAVDYAADGRTMAFAEGAYRK